MLSIVIPTLNAAAELPATLAALRAGEGGMAVEIVVSDGGSRDATAEIARAAGASVVCGAAGRGGQLARGAAACRGSWVLFLHADTHLPADWGRVVFGHIERGGGPAAFRLRFRAHGAAPAIVARWANIRSGLGLPYGDQGLLLDMERYRACGGFADIPLMEDVDIVRRLGRVTLLPVHVRTSAARYETEGWLRRSFRNGWIMLRYRLGASPQSLVAGYESGDVSSPN